MNRLRVNRRYEEIWKSHSAKDGFYCEGLDSLILACELARQVVNRQPRIFIRELLVRLKIRLVS